MWNCPGKTNEKFSGLYELKPPATLLDILDILTNASARYFRPVVQFCSSIDTMSSVLLRFVF